MRIQTLAIILCAGISLVACSPRKTVASYSYLLESDVEVNHDSPAARSASATTPASRTESGPMPSPAHKAALNDMELVVDKASTYLGTSYRYGGINENGIDCSGLVRKAYSVIGMDLPHSSSELSQMGESVKFKNLQVGDLVFFSAKGNGRIDHVGLVSEIQGEEVTFIHATTSGGVRYDRLDEGYWKPRFKLARRMAS